jgi:transposase
MYFCGIDVSKRQHAVLIMDDQGHKVRSGFSIKNNQAGFDELLAALQGLPEPVTVGLEATGHYWLSLYEALTGAAYPVVVLNPLQVHAYQRTGLRKVKTDRVDAFWIADFVRISRRPASNDQTILTLQLRELSRFRLRLSQQIGQCKQKILGVLERVFPEYEDLFSDVFIQSSRRLLAEAVAAHEFADFDLGEMADLLHQASRGQLGLPKAMAVHNAARQSVGISFLTDAVRMEVRCLLGQIELLETQRQEVDDALDVLMAQIPQYITSIPGIGPVTGATILAEIGDVRRFESLEKLVAYAGIHPTVHQSGQFQASKSRMSKRGSSYLRHALWISAESARQHDMELKAYYQRKKAEGKHHGTIIGAICRKLLARIYVVLKEHRPYEIRQPLPAQT